MTYEPACWSWPIPPLRDYRQTLDAMAAAMLELPADQQLSASALAFAYQNAAELRWAEFHTGVRPWAAQPPARCALCGRRGGGAYPLVTDHDHRTGLVRGYLCSSCNVVEGAGRRDVVHAYREWHPATILRHREYYVGYRWPFGWWLDLGQARRLTANPGWLPLPRHIDYDEEEIESV